MALCDISQNFDAFSQDCGYTLPDVLRTKVVLCYTQEMRAGFHFKPGRFGQNKNRNEASLLAESHQSCTPVPSRGRTRDCQTPLQERTWALSVHNADPSSGSWTRCSRTVVLEGEAPADPGFDRAESLSNRNAKLPCKPPVKFNMSANDGDKLENPPGSSGTQSSAEVNGVCVKFCEEMYTPTNSDAPGMSPQVSCQDDGAGADELTETCQRARVYLRKNDFSCARTGMPWPLVNSGLTRVPLAGPTLLADPPDTVSLSISTNEKDALIGCSGEQLFSAPDGPSSVSTWWIHQQKDESRDGFLTGGKDQLRGVDVSLAGASSPCSNTKSLQRRLLVSRGAQMVSCRPSYTPAHSYCLSPESSLLLPQHDRDFDEDLLSGPPKLLPHYEGSPTDDENNAARFLLCGACGEPDSALPPMLSPVTSPYRRSWGSLPSWSPGSFEAKKHEEDGTCRCKSPQLVHSKSGNSSDLQRGFQESEVILKPTSLTEAASNQNETKTSNSSTCADVSSDALDEVTAYKQDILLVDVTQDDAELFESLPRKSLLKLGPVRFSEEIKHRPLRTAKKMQLNSNRASVELGQR